MGERDKNTPLLEVKNLGKDFVSKGSKGKKTVHALNGISFTVYRGKPLGLWERADAARPLQAESSTV